MRTHSRWLACVAAFLCVSLISSTGCQTWYGGMTARKTPKARVAARADRLSARPRCPLAHLSRFPVLAPAFRD
jgi:hypothetical protein